VTALRSVLLLDAAIRSMRARRCVGLGISSVASRQHLPFDDSGGRLHGLHADGGDPPRRRRFLARGVSATPTIGISRLERGAGWSGA